MNQNQTTKNNKKYLMKQVELIVHTVSYLYHFYLHIHRTKIYVQ